MLVLKIILYLAIILNCFLILRTVIVYHRSKRKYTPLEIRLLICLHGLCDTYDIPIRFEKSLGLAAAQIHYAVDDEKAFIPESSRIYVTNHWKNDPYVLAHELGHFFAMRDKDDGSEEGADIEGRKLCEMFLDSDEKEILKAIMDKRFNGSGSVTDD